MMANIQFQARNNDGNFQTIKVFEMDRSHSDIKVGFVSYFSDHFYNIQLNISKSGIMEKGFKQINWILAQ